MVDVRKAIQAVAKFGCEAGYNSPGMFIVIVPGEGEEMTRVVPVSVYELEWISGAVDAADFQKRLNKVCNTDLSKIDSAIPACVPA